MDGSFSYTKSRSYLIRDHSDKNVENLMSKLQNLANSYFIHGNLSNVNDKTSYFLNSFWMIYNKECPLKTNTISYKKMTHPWIKEEHVRMMNFKHLLFKRFKMGIIEYDEYKQYRNRVDKTIRMTKKDTIKLKFSQIGRSNRENWKTVNSIIGRKTDKKLPVSLVDDYGCEVTNLNDISNLFCNYFSSIAEI